MFRTGVTLNSYYIDTGFLGITYIKFKIHSHQFKYDVTVIRSSLQKRLWAVVCVSAGSYQLCAAHPRIIRKSEQWNVVVG